MTIAARGNSRAAAQDPRRALSTHHYRDIERKLSQPTLVQRAVTWNYLARTATHVAPDPQPIWRFLRAFEALPPGPEFTGRCPAKAFNKSSSGPGKPEGSAPSSSRRFLACLWTSLQSGPSCLRNWSRSPRNISNCRSGCLSGKRDARVLTPSTLRFRTSSNCFHDLMTSAHHRRACATACVECKRMASCIDNSCGVILRMWIPTLALKYR